MADQPQNHQQTFERIRQVRAEALEYTRKARQLAAERRVLIKQLIAAGISKTDIARELGVTRQAIQKTITC
jgi:DNA-binding NarL/FixJ family response regulator